MSDGGVPYTHDARLVLKFSLCSNPDQAVHVVPKLDQSLVAEARRRARGDAVV